MNQYNIVLKNMERMTQPIRKIQHSIQPIIDMQNKIASIMSPLAPKIEQIGKILEKLPQRTQRAVMILANEGWFIDADFSLSSLLNIKHKTTEEIEELLMKYYEEKTDDIEKKLIDKFSNRTSIIKRAFYAHKKEMYELSIPIFLIQSDGICLDMTGHHFFYKKYGLQKYVESNLSDKLFDEFLGPLKEKIPLTLSERDRDKNFNKLNRHMILHGESTEYATRLNSLKAISFMAYLLEFLEKDEAK